MDYSKLREHHGKQVVYFDGDEKFEGELVYADMGRLKNLAFIRGNTLFNQNQVKYIHHDSILEIDSKIVHIAVKENLRKKNKKRF